MRHFVEIVEPVEVAGEYNEIEKTWRVKSDAWADIIDSESDFQFILDGELVSANKVIKIRYTDELKDGDGIKQNGKIYRIANAENEKELNRYLILYLVNYHG